MSEFFPQKPHLTHINLSRILVAVRGSATMTLPGVNSTRSQDRHAEDEAGFLVGLGFFQQSRTTGAVDSCFSV